MPGIASTMRKNNFNSLPRVIIYEILTRVPAESLVRFKIVCKLWKTILSHPEFISSHLHIWKPNPSIIITDLMSAGSFLWDFQDTDSIDFAITFPKGYSSFVASTDGLLLLEALTFSHPIKKGGGHAEEVVKLCVYNPVTGSQKFLPPNSNLSMIGCNFSMVHDASIRKYKVVVFIDDIRSILEKIIVITVDDSDQGCEWRELINPSTFFMQAICKPITVNGLLFWLAYTYDIERIDTPLMAFIQSVNIAEEEFMQRISLPCQPKTDSTHLLMNCNLLEIKGSLCFSNPATDMELELWVLEDLGNHIWAMKHKICLLWIVGRPTSLSSFLLSESFFPIQIMGNDGGLMMIRHDPDNMGFLEGRGWYLYNLRSKELKAIVCRSSKERKYFYYPAQKITHVKSLVGWN